MVTRTHASRALATLLAATLLGACAHARPVPEIDAGRGFFGPDGRRLGEAELASAADRAAYVLVGETHDSACDHEMQAALLEALAANGSPPLVGLEMVAVNQQDVLDRFGDGSIELADLADALDWQRSWGVDFALYEPVFATARRWGLPLLGLNLPHRLVRDVARLGVDGLPPEDRARLPEIVPPPPEQEGMLREAWKAHARDGHSGGGEEGFRRFVLVQSLWDSQMAAAAISWRRALGREPVAILAGAGHVAHGWGIAWRLRAMEPDATILSVVPWRDDRPADAPGTISFRCSP
ncbi:MAG TPA: ChaN family lipoprotein [Vulgatibacter sp.]|nr:ChaN family lipoprotein [Vulgatibacter sp.]